MHARKGRTMQKEKKERQEIKMRKREKAIRLARNRGGERRENYRRKG